MTPPPTHYGAALVAVGVQPPQGWQGPSLRLSTPDLGPVRGLDTPWALLWWEGEAHPRSLVALERIRDILAELDEDTAVVEVERVEDSATGPRTMPVGRAVRVQALLELEPLPDLGVRVAGRPHRLEDVQLVLDRARAPDGTGLAERCEREGCWTEAARTWVLATGERGPRAAWGRVRAAAALEQVAPGSMEIRDLLGQALACCARLLEAHLRLAAWHLRRGALDEVLALAAQADALPSALPRVPHPHGAGSWLVSEAISRWLADVDPTRAALAARMALARGAPPPLAKKLTERIERSARFEKTVRHDPGVQ